METGDDAAHSNVVAQTSQARAQGTSAAHDEIDLHPGAGGAIQGLDYGLVQEGVDLRDDASRTTVPGMAGFSLNQLYAVLGQIDRRHEEWLIVALLGTRG